MTGTGQNGHKPGDQRCEEGDVFWVAAKHTLCQTDQIIHPAGDLHRGNRGDNRHDDFDNIKGDRAGLYLEDQRQYQYA
ncbi:Uncharacterised protein [Kluyvera cryocrescens]|nr:Uncharacterised protein [Kluyvera cryocrescens]